MSNNDSLKKYVDDSLNPSEGISLKDDNSQSQSPQSTSQVSFELLNLLEGKIDITRFLKIMINQKK